MSELEYWLAVNMLQDVGPVLVRRLLSAFGTPENVFHASYKELRGIQGVGESRARQIVSFNLWNSVRKEIQRARNGKIHLIHLRDSRYPEKLRHINDAPPVLYVKGELRKSDQYSIAMVGSRSATEYGRNVAERLSYKLASYGLTVVSGMARGIDTASHKGALKAGGRTIAVLGSGINVPYPFENKELMKSIEPCGAVISEFPMGTGPNRENFPRRNRIISALSLGVIVVEATLDSGSLITVRYALEQGKEIFAVPGNVTGQTSKGTNDLIKNGARLIDDADDVVRELRLQLQGYLREEASTLPDMSGEERLIYGFLSEEPRHIDSITRGSKMPPEKTLSLLLSLELKGIVRQGEGKHFSLQ